MDNAEMGTIKNGQCRDTRQQWTQDTMLVQTKQNTEN